MECLQIQVLPSLISSSFKGVVWKYGCFKLRLPCFSTIPFFANMSRYQDMPRYQLINKSYFLRHNKYPKIVNNKSVLLKPWSLQLRFWINSSQTRLRSCITWSFFGSDFVRGCSNIMWKTHYARIFILVYFTCVIICINSCSNIMWETPYAKMFILIYFACVIICI